MIIHIFKYTINMCIGNSYIMTSILQIQLIARSIFLRPKYTTSKLNLYIAIFYSLNTKLMNTDIQTDAWMLDQMLL